MIKPKNQTLNYNLNILNSRITTTSILNMMAFDILLMKAIFVPLQNLTLAKIEGKHVMVSVPANFLQFGGE